MVLETLGSRSFWMKIVAFVMGYVGSDVLRQMYEGLTFGGDLPDEVFGGAILVGMWYQGYDLTAAGGAAYGGVQLAQRAIENADTGGSGGSNGSGGN